MSVRFPVLVLFSLCHILCVSCFGSYHVVFVWFDFAVLGLVSSVEAKSLAEEKVSEMTSLVSIVA